MFISLLFLKFMVNAGTDSGREDSSSKNRAREGQNIVRPMTSILLHYGDPNPTGLGHQRSPHTIG
jgi:hypothetical protein